MAVSRYCLSVLDGYVTCYFSIFVFCSTNILFQKWSCYSNISHNKYTKFHSLVLLYTQIIQENVIFDFYQMSTFHPRFLIMSIWKRILTYKFLEGYHLQENCYKIFSSVNLLLIWKHRDIQEKLTWNFHGNFDGILSRGVTQFYKFPEVKTCFLHDI